MADFGLAYNITMKHEGGYVNNPNDRGGETYKGISRKFHPKWFGWRIIDDYKTKPDFPKNLNHIPELQDAIGEFYKSMFWDVFELDKRSQEIANEIFDTAINVGKQKATTMIQSTVNVLNRNTNAYPDIKVDGVYGSNTSKYMDECIKYNGERLVLNVLNAYQVKHYLELMERNPSQEQFIGWFNRVEIKRG